MSIYKRLLMIVQTIIIFLLLAAGAVYGYEQRMDFDDIMVYYAVIPSKSAFDKGDSIEFFSFNDSKLTSSKVNWTEVSYCNDGKNFATNIYGQPTNAIDHYRVMEVPPNIKTILEIIRTNGNAAEHPVHRGVLYNYAINNKSSWKLEMASPMVGSTCQTTHTITVTTPIFGLIKAHSLNSPMWTYGMNAVE